MIGLIDIDGKLPNFALMKISSYYKSMGEQVEFVKGNLGKYEKIYASCLFSWNRNKCEELLAARSDIIVGGSGWSLDIKLPDEIECCKPDYDLYGEEIVYSRSCKGGIASKTAKAEKAHAIANMGVGFTSRGCIRNCEFCVVPKKEGHLHQVSEIKDIINPRSSIITLYDNNLTADPTCIEKLQEIRDRGLTVDISQGIDVRILTPEKAKALGEVKHLRSLHYAWDLMQFEDSVLKGIGMLSKHVKKWRHMCYVLCGFNTSHEEDLYRVMKLKEIGVSPYIMKYNNRQDDVRLNHFARWVNGRFFKVCNFNEYEPYAATQHQLELF